MTRQEYIDDVLLSLGFPIVEVEIQELVGKLVDKAFREVSRYVTETHFVTLPYSKTGIDLTDYHVNAVEYIFRPTNPAKIGDLTDVYVLSSIYTNTTSTSTLLSDYFTRTQMHQLKSTMSTDLDFTYDKAERKLYVNTFYPYPTKLTIVYIPEFYDVSDIHEMFWVNYIQRLSLAFAKETLGRVRGKYDLSSSLYKLDGSSLVSEGIAERDAIREELNENSDILFPID